MKKAEQKAINNNIIKAWDEAVKYLKNYNDYKCKRLRSCSAQVIITDRYYYLRSYNTIIAFIDRDTDILFDVLRYVYGYTSTSAQHIAKFRRDYGCGKWGCTIEQRYYNV